MTDTHYDAQWRPLIDPFDAIQLFFDLSLEETRVFYEEFIFNGDESDVMQFTADCAHALGRRPSCNFNCK